MSFLRMSRHAWSLECGFGNKGEVVDKVAKLENIAGEIKKAVED